MKTVYYADCEQFDNAGTGYYATPQEAEAAFWQENLFSENERARVVVYTRGEDAASPGTLERATYLAGEGSPSPALGICAS